MDTRSGVVIAGVSSGLQKGILPTPEFKGLQGAAIDKGVLREVVGPGAVAPVQYVATS